MRYSQLLEKAPQSTIFGLIKIARAKLTPVALRAIDEWESSNWHTGKLVAHIKANDEVAQNIEMAFAPVRDRLPETITLYRGIIIDPEFKSWEKGILDSWSSDVRTAELFAGLRYGEKWTSQLETVLTDDQIAEMVARYERTGFLKTRSYYFIRNKEMPQYYNIFSRDKSFLTDGDDLAEKLHSDNDWIKERNEKLKSKSKVFHEEVDRDRVVWITNQLNCKEFIVRR
jgi:hypothetical protein